MQSPITFIVLFLLVLTNLSCETDSSNIETVDIDDFLPKSNKEYNYEKDTINDVEENAPDSIQLLVQAKIENINFPSSSEVTHRKYFPDRLDYTQRFYHELSIDSISYELVVWEFEDSLHTVNAFYNWMDCFGKKCKSIRVGDSKWIYDGAFQLFVDDSKLIYVATENKMDQKLWADLFEPTLKKRWNYHLYQPFKRKVQWLELTE